jgi:hypothetical protein
MCFGNGRLAIFEDGYIATRAGEGLSEEDAVFVCGGGVEGSAPYAWIQRWEFWHV